MAEKRTWKDLSYKFFEIGGSLESFISDIREYDEFSRKLFIKNTFSHLIRTIWNLKPEEIEMIVYIIKKSGITLEEINSILDRQSVIHESSPDQLEKIRMIRDIFFKNMAKAKLVSPYQSVEEYYKQDCKSKDECDCIPYINDRDKYRKPCGFHREPLITDPKTKIDIFISYGYEIKEANQEALDFIKEFPVFILKKGTTLCHSTYKTRLLVDDMGALMIPKDLWWNKFMVGQEKYKGGWFTYETPYGGPGFGISLFYKVQEDIPLLFIPNYRKHADDPNYFPYKDYPWNYRGGEEFFDPNEFSGSHIVQGVKDWKSKGYKIIKPLYFADELAERLTSLGFPGYISCDECEVFITHKSMKRMLDQPPYRVKAEVGKKNKYKTTFDMVADILCKGDKYCPLKINPGSRENMIDMEVLDSEKKFGIKHSDFLKKYQKEFQEILRVTEKHKFHPSRRG